MTEALMVCIKCHKKIAPAELVFGSLGGVTDGFGYAYHRKCAEARRADLLDQRQM